MKRIAAWTLLIAGVVAQAASGADKKAVSDDRIYDQVHMRLTTDADVKGGALEISVANGQVTLKGRVDSEKRKSRATKLAKKVKGVKDVDNELTVGPPAS